MERTIVCVPKSKLKIHSGKKMLLTHNSLTHNSRSDVYFSQWISRMMDSFWTQSCKSHKAGGEHRLWLLTQWFCNSKWFLMVCVCVCTFMVMPQVHTAPVKACSVSERTSRPTSSREIRESQLARTTCSSPLEPAMASWYDPKAMCSTHTKHWEITH